MRILIDMFDEAWSHEDSPALRQMIVEAIDEKRRLHVEREGDIERAFREEKPFDLKCDELHGLRKDPEANALRIKEIETWLDGWRTAKVPKQYAVEDLLRLSGKEEDTTGCIEGPFAAIYYL